MSDDSAPLWATNLCAIIYPDKSGITDPLCIVFRDLPMLEPSHEIKQFFFFMRSNIDVAWLFAVGGWGNGWLGCDAMSQWAVV